MITENTLIKTDEKIDHDKESLELFSLLPKNQIDEVLNQEMCDIAPQFLGFVSIYKRLSELIPTDHTIFDFGCAYNAQCFYFKYHVKYIAIDIGNIKRFKANNCEIIEMRISEFIANHLDKYKTDKDFAICSYVPDWGGNNIDLVKANFQNVFTYYPCEL